MNNTRKTGSTLMHRRDQVAVQERMKRDQGEQKTMAKLVNKVAKDNKIIMPPSKDNFMRICKGLNMHCTEMLAFEGLLYCRGKNMEEGSAEEFDFDRMIAFLNMK